MGGFIVRIIRPVERTPEFEYIKEFFRFIGFLVTDCTVDDKGSDGTISANWLKALIPDEKSNCIDIVMNCPSDPYEEQCRQLGSKRIYCVADFASTMMCGSVVPKPTVPVPNNENIANKRELRHKFLEELTDNIWDDESERAEIRKILGIYLKDFPDSSGELFYTLQAKRNLRVLAMGEVLRERTAQVTKIALLPYIRSCIVSLWSSSCELKTCTGLHGRYAWVNASNKLHEIIGKLYDTERIKIPKIKYRDDNGEETPCCPPGIPTLIKELELLVSKEPAFLSAYLLMANIFGAYGGMNNEEERCYQRLWRAVSRNSPDYAFIWYRNAYFYEKRKINLDRALEYYRYAVKLDPNCYQAWFKLGYYAAAEDRFEQAEYLLKQMIKAIFCGRSTDPDENGEYSNWLSLSSKKCQYVYKAYILMAKIALNRTQENALRIYIGRACMAATWFEEAVAIRHISHFDEIQKEHEMQKEYEGSFKQFELYHRYSTPVWAMWQVLSPWTEDVIHDSFVRNIVRDRLARWRNG